VRNLRVFLFGKRAENKQIAAEILNDFPWVTFFVGGNRPFCGQKNNRKVKKVFSIFPLTYSSPNGRLKHNGQIIIFDYWEKSHGKESIQEVKGEGFG